MEGKQERNEVDAGASARILLMEDEINLAKGLKMVLGQKGYWVELAPSGRRALRHLEERAFDLLVADLKLPDIDGLEVIRNLHDRSPETGVIVITGYPSVESAVDAMKLGARDYLAKPFTEEEFLSAVQKALVAGMERLGDLEPRDQENLIQRREVIRVLERAIRESDFWVALLEDGSYALKDYRLSWEAKAAILAGDLNWLRENVGELSREQLRWVWARLEVERW